MPMPCKTPLALLASYAIVAYAGPACAAGAILLKDDFNGPAVDASLWHMPTWTSPSDGTYIGRTQLAVTQNSSLPAIVGGKVLIPVQTYNPRATSFYGAELISNQAFALGQGLDITVRAKISTTQYPGTVGGIFLYTLKPGSDTLHDEIDFEFLTSRPGDVQTNIYGNEPLGLGHTQFIPYASGSSMTDYHTYEIQWKAANVSWLIDGKLVRETTEHVPAGPMQFYLNNWVPDGYWPQAFSPAIQPVEDAADNKVLNALTVDSVTIRSLKP